MDNEQQLLRSGVNTAVMKWDVDEDIVRDAHPVGLDACMPGWHSCFIIGAHHTLEKRRNGYNNLKLVTLRAVLKGPMHTTISMLLYQLLRVTYLLYLLYLISQLKRQ